MFLIKTSDIQSLNLKPWITPGLANSFKIKNKLYKSFWKEKDPH